MQDSIGISFADPLLLRQALVHRSYLNENPAFALPSNERLEFLGDAVLGFLTAEYLYYTYPHMPEGELTALRATLVREETLARIANSLSLGQCLYLGRGEEASGGRERPTLLACAMEAVLGSLFLDQGLEATRAFLLPFLTDELAHIDADKPIKDHKSRLQELAQEQWKETPTYRVVATTGPDHDRRFTVEVLVGDVSLGHGQGKSKQEAEMEAARYALAHWPPESRLVGIRETEGRTRP